MVKQLLELEALAPHRLPGMPSSRDPGLDFDLAPLTVVPVCPYNCETAANTVAGNLPGVPFGGEFNL